MSDCAASYTAACPRKLHNCSSHDSSSVRQYKERTQMIMPTSLHSCMLCDKSVWSACYRATPMEAEEDATAYTQQQVEQQQQQHESVAKSGRPPRPARQALRLTKKLRPAKQDVTAGAAYCFCPVHLQWFGHAARVCRLEKPSVRGFGLEVSLNLGAGHSVCYHSRHAVWFRRLLQT